MKKLYIFRHGETNWNKNKETKLSKESHDVELNEIGIQQAENLAKYLQNKGIEEIYCSNLKRARHTAEILASLIKVNIKIINGLEEFSIYDDTVYGLTRSEIQELVGYEKHKIFRENRDELLDWRPLKCQTKREARERILSTILSICKKDNHKIIGISSHGMILRELLRVLDYEDDSKLVNCEIVEAEFDEENIKIIQRTKAH